MRLGPTRLLVIFSVILALVSDTESFKRSFYGNSINVRYKPITRNIDTKNTKACPTSRPIHITGRTSAKTFLINTGVSIQTNNQRSLVGTISSGFLGKSVYNYLSFTYYWASNVTTGVTGTTINKNGFPYGVRVFYINQKYKTFPAALKHEDGFVDLIYLFEICSTPNKRFGKLSKQIQKIPKAGSFTVVPLKTHILASDFTKSSGQYYTYKGKFLDTFTNKTYLSSTVILFKLNEQACITQHQFNQTFSHLVNFTGQTLANVLTHDSSELQTSLCSGIHRTLLP